MAVVHRRCARCAIVTFGMAPMISIRISASATMVSCTKAVAGISRPKFVRILIRAFLPSHWLADSLTLCPSSGKSTQCKRCWCAAWRKAICTKTSGLWHIGICVDRRVRAILYTNTCNYGQDSWKKCQIEDSIDRRSSMMYVPQTISILRLLVYKFWWNSMGTHTHCYKYIFFSVSRFTVRIASPRLSRFLPE